MLPALVAVLLVCSNPAGILKPLWPVPCFNLAPLACATSSTAALSMSTVLDTECTALDKLTAHWVQSVLEGMCKGASSAVGRFAGTLKGDCKNKG